MNERYSVKYIRIESECTKIYIYYIGQHITSKNNNYMQIHFNMFNIHTTSIVYESVFNFPLDQCRALQPNPKSYQSYV